MSNSQSTNSRSHRPRILLVGATGQVGSELIQSLPMLGDVTATVRPLNQPSRFRHLDLTDKDQIRHCVREVRPDLIVNAAAYTAVDRAESEADLAFAINSTAVSVLAEEAARASAAIVHYSTDYVFDGSGERPWKETDSTGPLNVYGCSKLEGEQRLQEINAPFLLLRVCWVYGLHGANFVKTMLKLGRDRDELSIVADQFGSPTSARVISDATTTILAQAKGNYTDFLNQYGGIYHLACDGETNWCEFAKHIFAIASGIGIPLQIQRVLPIATVDYPTPAIRPTNSRMNFTKLQDAFGIAPPHWDHALESLFFNLQTGWNGLLSEIEQKNSRQVA